MKIAIVGLGAILPGAHSVSAFWSNALAGRSSISQPTAAARFDPARYLNADPNAPDRARVFAGGYVVDRWEFDWRRFRLPPADATAMNPMHFIALSAASEALAGVERLHRENTAVILGASGL